MSVTPARHRKIVRRTRGRRHGPITRLVSPGDLGQDIKPFVFLDLLDSQGADMPGFGLHPHSGIATLTWLMEGSAGYEDTSGRQGVISAGGVEWMVAGAGAWHAGGAAAPGRVRGFQLWVALPPDSETMAPTSTYLEAAQVPTAGPAHVLLGAHGGARSPLVTPAPLNYLAVRLRAGEDWEYQPPPGHTVAWLALSAGTLALPEALEAGELAVFAPAQDLIRVTARTDGEFVLGSAVPHPYPLVTGYYSVHTSVPALQAGEARIAALGNGLRAQGRLK